MPGLPVPLAAGQEGALPQAAEQDAALALSGYISAALAFATETDVAQAFIGRKSAAFAQVTETDAVQVVTGRKIGALPVAVETDEALGFTRLVFVSAGGGVVPLQLREVVFGAITPAVERDTALHLESRSVLNEKQRERELVLALA